MKPLKTLLYLLLIPFAIFLTSCNNEIPEEFLIIADSSPGSYSLDDVDYFEIIINKVPEGGEVFSEQPIFDPDVEITFIPPVFEGRLYKGDVLRLGDLEPGKYELSGWAKHVDENGGDPWTVGEVIGISDKMETEIIEEGRDTIYNNYLIIDEFSPTVVKLIVSLYYNPGP